MTFTPEQVNEIREMLANPPKYPDIPQLIADGHLIRRTNGYEPLTLAGADALMPFIKSVLNSNKTGKPIFKIYPKGKS